MRRVRSWGEIALDTEADQYTTVRTTLDVTGRLVTLLRGGAAAVLVWPDLKQKNFWNQGFPFHTLSDFQEQQIKQASKMAERDA